MHPASQRARRRRRNRPRGFTLLETALAVIIIGVGVVAVVDAQQSFMMANRWSSHAATATYLANEVRELTRPLRRHDPVTGLEIVGSALVGWGPEPGEVTVGDFNDIDDFAGIRFGDGGDMPGPINGFGEVIFEIDPDGNVVRDNDSNPVPMRGWSQLVLVDKVHPFDTSLSLAPNYFEPASGTSPGRAVDEFPLRVTVVVSYREPGAAQAEEIVRVSWIVP